MGNLRKALVIEPDASERLRVKIGNMTAKVPTVLIQNCSTEKQDR